jgi:Na+/H+ antiporter NhaD/arsenite permease-like protein
LRVALIGLATITAYKVLVTGLPTGPGVGGLLSHLGHEWVILANLFGLLVGFALLSRHFEESQIPEVLPRFLPDDWKGGLMLLFIVWILSSFLDNIAAALIGGTIARHVFRGKVHIGYLAAIVASSNAGGAWSVVGDTTTTMMWIDGVSPAAVLPAIVASAVAVVISVDQQHRYSPIQKDEGPHRPVDWGRVGIVAIILVSAICVNVYVNSSLGALGEAFPWLGAAVWVALLATAPIRRPDWSQIKPAALGSIFLLSRVLCASMMPFEKLPLASWQSSLGLGFVSAVFDNIPLTGLAISRADTTEIRPIRSASDGSMLWFVGRGGTASQYREAGPRCNGCAMAGTFRWLTWRAFWSCWPWWAGTRRPSAPRPHSRRRKA